MKSLTNAKKVLVVIMTLAIIGLTGSVFAADNSGFTFSNSSSNSSSGNSSGNTSGNISLGNNSNGNSSNSNSSSNNSGNSSNSSGNSSNSSGNTGNTSNYSKTNSTDLPDTGLEDHIPLVAGIAIFGISAMYALKKVRDYRSL